VDIINVDRSATAGQWGAFDKGQAGMRIDGSWMVSGYRENAPFEFGTAMLPIPAGGTNATNMGGEQIFAFNKDANTNRAAVKFISWFTSAPIQARWDAVTNFMPIRASVASSPVMLKHMVDDKIHSRSSGPLVMLTRQPAEGRARDGGLRFGEMERDCIVAHGATEFLKEIMMEKSDNFQCHVCKSCGLIGLVNPKAGIFKCVSCPNTTEFSQVRVPYAYKLFLQELESMSICSRLLPESRLRALANDTILATSNKLRYG
jgi:ribosomal protein L37AE/L43A